MRRFLPFVSAAVLLVAGPLLVGPAFGPPDNPAGDEGSLTARLNGERTSRGLGALAVSGDLVALARRHSQDMASQNRLYDDPNLSREVRGWQRVGENTGTGSSADQVHDAFMASSSHRARSAPPSRSNGSRSAACCDCCSAGRQNPDFFGVRGRYCAARRQRSHASMKPSRSPSRVASTLPVSWSVRRSFTSW